MHFGVAGIINASKIKDIATTFFGSAKSGPGEEGGSVQEVSKRGSKGGPVGGDLAVVENKKTANWRIPQVGEVEVGVFGKRFKNSV